MNMHGFLVISLAFTFPVSRGDIQGNQIDFSGCVREEDGRCCVLTSSVQPGQVAEQVQECRHRLVEVCHYTYVTIFKPHREEVCGETFTKKCYISFRTSVNTEKIKKCYRPVKKVCDGTGPEECKTVHETSCTTKYVQKNKKFVGDTVCTKLPIELCGPGCRFEEGDEECHEKDVVSENEIPEESCDLQPLKTCQYVTKLSPSLSPKHVCTKEPASVCLLSSKSVSTERPLLSKWCLLDNATNVEEFNSDVTNLPDIKNEYVENDDVELFEYNKNKKLEKLQLVKNSNTFAEVEINLKSPTRKNKVSSLKIPVANNQPTPPPVRPEVFLNAPVHPSDVDSEFTLDYDFNPQPKEQFSDEVFNAPVQPIPPPIFRTDPPIDKKVLQSTILIPPTRPPTASAGFAKFLDAPERPFDLPQTPMEPAFATLTTKRPLQGNRLQKTFEGKTPDTPDKVSNVLDILTSKEDVQEDVNVILEFNSQKEFSNKTLNSERNGKKLSTLQGIFSEETPVGFVEEPPKFESLKLGLEPLKESLKPLKGSLEQTEKVFGSTDRSLKSTVRSLKSTEKRLESTDRSVESTDRRLETTDRRLESTDRSLESTDRRLKSTDRRLESIDRRLESTDRRLESIDRIVESTDRRLESTDRSLESTDRSLESTDRSLKTADTSLDSKSKHINPNLAEPSKTTENRNGKSLNINQKEINKQEDPPPRIIQENNKIENNLKTNLEKMKNCLNCKPKQFGRNSSPQPGNASSSFKQSSNSRKSTQSSHPRGNKKSINIQETTQSSIPRASKQSSNPRENGQSSNPRGNGQLSNPRENEKSSNSKTTGQPSNLRKNKKQSRAREHNQSEHLSSLSSHEKLSNTKNPSQPNKSKSQRPVLEKTTQALRKNKTNTQTNPIQATINPVEPRPSNQNEKPGIQKEIRKSTIEHSTGENSPSTDQPTSKISITTSSRPIEQPTTSSRPIEQPTTSNQPIEQPTTSSRPIKQPTTSVSSRPKEQKTSSRRPKQQTSTSSRLKQQMSTSSRPKQQTSTSRRPKQQTSTSSRPKQQTSTSRRPKQQTSTSRRPKVQATLLTTIQLNEESRSMPELDQRTKEPSQLDRPATKTQPRLPLRFGQKIPETKDKSLLLVHERLVLQDEEAYPEPEAEPTHPAENSDSKPKPSTHSHLNNHKTHTRPRAPKSFNLNESRKNAYLPTNSDGPTQSLNQRRGKEIILSPPDLLPPLSLPAYKPSEPLTPSTKPQTLHTSPTQPPTRPTSPTQPPTRLTSPTKQPPTIPTSPTKPPTRPTSPTQPPTRPAPSTQPPLPVPTTALFEDELPFYSLPTYYNDLPSYTRPPPLDLAALTDYSQQNYENYLQVDSL